MRRHSDLHQSAAISAVLLVLLFALPLAVVVPFQTELFSGGFESPGGGGPDVHPVQDADRRQPRRHRGHLHGLHLLPGVYLGGKRPEQLGRERGRL